VPRAHGRWLRVERARQRCHAIKDNAMGGTKVLVFAGLQVVALVVLGGLLLGGQNCPLTLGETSRVETEGNVNLLRGC
jgi:hypothetical protein